MADLMLTFAEPVSDARRDALLREAAGWHGVQAAAPLHRDARHGRFGRFCFVRVDDDEADTVSARLRQLPEVETVEAPPRRGLASD